MTTYNSRNPYIQALYTPSSNHATYHTRSVSPLPPSYTSRLYESPRVTTSVTSYHTPGYNYSTRTTRSTSVAPSTVRARQMSPSIPHIAHQRLTRSSVVPRTSNSYLDDLDLVGTNGQSVTSLSRYDDDLATPLIQQLEQDMSGLRAQINTVNAKIHDRSHLTGMNNVYTVPGFSARGERTGTERPGRTNGFADSHILGPMRDVHHDVHNISRYEDPGKKIGIGKGHLACLEYAGGKPVLKRRQKFYDDEKIPLEIKILSNYNNKPRHERRGPVEPKARNTDVFAADGYVPWRERLAKDLTYVAPETAPREEIPAPEVHNPDRNWEIPEVVIPRRKTRQGISEPEVPQPNCEDPTTPHPISAPEPFGVVSEPVDHQSEPVVNGAQELADEVEEVVVVKKDKKKKKHSRVEQNPEPEIDQAPEASNPKSEAIASESAVLAVNTEIEPEILEPVPDTQSIPHLNIESDIEELIVDHQNAEGYDEHVRSDCEQVFNVDRRFVYSDDAASPLPVTPLPEEVPESATPQEPVVAPEEEEVPEADETIEPVAETSELVPVAESSPVENLQPEIQEIAKESIPAVEDIEEELVQVANEDGNVAGESEDVPVETAEEEGVMEETPAEPETPVITEDGPAVTEPEEVAAPLEDIPTGNEEVSLVTEDEIDSVNEEVKAVAGTEEQTYDD